MSSRIAKIRARLAAVNDEEGAETRLCFVTRAEEEIVDKGPGDIAWLLSELDAARERVAILRHELSEVDATLRDRAN